MSNTQHCSLVDKKHTKHYHHQNQVGTLLYMVSNASEGQQLWTRFAHLCIFTHIQSHCQYYYADFLQL